nr:hypothetical protein [Tanacetum cinerariifolium]
MEDLKQQYLDDLKRLSNLEYHDEIKIAELKENFNGMSIEIQKKEKLLQQEQWAYLALILPNIYILSALMLKRSVVAVPLLILILLFMLRSSLIFRSNPFPPADRSDFYEFTDELIPFISPSEYDCFLFKVEPNSRDFTKDVVEDISPKNHKFLILCPHIPPFN